MKDLFRKLPICASTTEAQKQPRCVTVVKLSERLAITLADRGKEIFVSCVCPCHLPYCRRAEAQRFIYRSAVLAGGEEAGPRLDCIGILVDLRAFMSSGAWDTRRQPAGEAKPKRVCWAHGQKSSQAPRSAQEQGKSRQAPQRRTALGPTSEHRLALPKGAEVPGRRSSSHIA